MAHCARSDGRAHLPDTIRLWQGDSVGRWEGDTLVVDTTNLNGKTWLNEGGEIVSYAEHVVERFTPAGPDTRQLRGDHHRSGRVHAAVDDRLSAASAKSSSCSRPRVTRKITTSRT